MSNREQLKSLMIDVFLLDPADFRFDMTREEVPTWDSLGVISLAVGVHQTFGYHFTPEEALGIQGVGDVMTLLETKGISFDA